MKQYGQEIAGVDGDEGDVCADRQDHLEGWSRSAKGFSGVKTRFLFVVGTVGGDEEGG